MLNGLTIITHGYALTAGTPTWLTSMGNAVASQLGLNTAIYKMTLGYDTNNRLDVTDFSLKQGSVPSSAANSNAQTVLLIDWSQDSGIGVLTPYFSTTQLADFITPFLVNPLPSVGITAPLAEGPVHLIGHSRGASLMSEIAKDLGQEGIWVDQLTTLDPHPIDSDAPVAPTLNVNFADNYYHLDPSNPITDPSGAQSTGLLMLVHLFLEALAKFSILTCIFFTKVQ